MRVVFAGTPHFALPALEALVEHHEVVAVFTRPDRPAGRGLRPSPSPVKHAAQHHGLVIFQPATLKNPTTHAELRALAPDAVVVAAYGLILPQAILDIPRYGALNIHASLLPRWRGAAPIQRALLAGDHSTGVCIMRMEAALDTGPLLLCEATPIGAELLIRAIEGLQRGALRAVPQAIVGVSYANKIEKSEARIDWTGEAAKIERQVRAFNPFPGATSRIGTSEIKVWRARLAAAPGALPGTILSVEPDGVAVACGNGALKLVELQRPGGKRLPASELANGFPLRPGDRFETS
jgi:methionyl-tRNA formyltransferase